MVVVGASRSADHGISGATACVAQTLLELNVLGTFCFLTVASAVVLRIIHVPGEALQTSVEEAGRQEGTTLSEGFLLRDNGRVLRQHRVEELSLTGCAGTPECFSGPLSAKGLPAPTVHGLDQTHLIQIVAVVRLILVGLVVAVPVAAGVVVQLVVMGVVVQQVNVAVANAMVWATCQLVVVVFVAFVVVVVVVVVLAVA